MIISQLDEQGVLSSLILIGNSESSILGSTDYRLWRQKIQRLIKDLPRLLALKNSALLTLPRKNFAFLEASDVVSVSELVDLG